MGECFAQIGHQRTAGRVLGFLLVCDPVEQSIDELVREVGASKASISITLRLLTAHGLVERVGKPGERRGFYRLRPGAWTTDLRAKVGQFAGMRQLAEDGLAALGDVSAARRERLEGMRDLYAFFEREFPGLIERWLAEVQARRR